MFKISDISLWLHNKLGTSNDSWISGSICSQLNKEVLRNIKDCFPDLQTQVKLKLLLSFFHIPKRLVEEWKPELEEIIEVAGLDSELWVSMIAETMKTFPSSGSLNTEITEYEETRPIFTDMVNELKRLVTKNYDMSMLPLECQYLNKSALVSVVGQQAAPVKHFTMKRKPKSQTLRAELLQKSSDAQSSIKKVSAPTVPLRSRGMPRKMTDTTPMKGIPSRVPTSGFRSPPASQNQQRPSASRTTAGRKDGGIKLLDITEQPLGYAAAKKRKRQQDLEEQAKKAQEAQSAQEATLVVKSEPNSSAGDVGASTLSTTTTPDYAAGLAPSTVYSQPATPLTSIVSSTSVSTAIKKEINNQISNNSKIDNNDNSNNNEMMEVDTNETLCDKDISITHIKMEPPATPHSLNTTNIVNMSDHKLMTSNVPKLASISSQTPTLTSISSSNASHSTIKIVKIEQPDHSPPTSSAATLNKIITMTSSATTRPLLTRTTFVPASTQQTIIMSSSNKTATIGGRTLTLAANNSSVSANSQQNQLVAPTVPKQPKISTQEIKQEIKYVTKTIAAPTIQKAGGQTTITQENLQKILSQANLILTKTGATTQNPQHSANSPIKQQQPLTQFTIQQQQQSQQTQHPRSSTSTSTLPTLTTTISRSQLQQVHQQQLQQQQTQIAKQTTITQKSQPTKIVQIKTTPTIQNLVSSSMQNIPPLIPTNQSYVLGSSGGQRKTLTFTAQNPQTSNIIQTSLGQIQIQQHPNQPVQQQTIQLQPQVSTQSTQQQQQQQPKYAQVMLSPNNMNMKGKTIILANPSILNQKGVILRTVGPSGNTVYQQISGLSGHTIIQQQSGGPPSLIKSNDQQSTTTMQQLPALIPTNQSIPSLTPVMIQSSSTGGQQQKGISTLINQHTLPQQTIIRPVQGGQMTLIQRPGQQAQLVQTISQPQSQSQQAPQRIIMTQPQPAIHIQQVPQNPAPTIQIQQIQPIVVQQNQLQQQTTQAQGTRKGLSLSNLHILEAHDMFKKANRVTRLEKAIILGFMAGYRDNPRPNPDNVVVIKLNESKENVTQDDDTKVPMLVESLIRLDYNTGEWKTFRKYRKLDQNQQVEAPISSATVTT